MSNLRKFFIPDGDKSKFSLSFELVYFFSKSKLSSTSKKIEIGSTTQLHMTTELNIFPLSYFLQFFQISGHISRRSINLGIIFPWRSATATRCAFPPYINNNFLPVSPASARPPITKRPVGFTVFPFSRKNLKGDNIFN